MSNCCLVLPYLPGGTELARTNHPWAVRFHEFAIKAYCIDFSTPTPPLNENIIDWNEK